MVFSSALPSEIKSILEASRNSGNTAGFTASTAILANETLAKNPQLLKLAAIVLENPLLQRQLCDRVYELMQEDLRRQKERCQNYGRRF
ncbi:MAG: hypothetical protein SAJ12_11090 [Jaaginema sp. PMC 1079.18]|nr:hypothetical protein [Jaaginema sp. PMC 1080.18]MEC4851547.1 hypothetical protein [Jaaginema sp. PMC 1079.18]MEC4869134.1 hypothetical protein [Jaaginema sp. PMC 1078.18]